MNNLSTNTPFLGLGGSGGSRPTALSGGAPLLSASAQDVAASFSELLRGNSAKAAPPQPAPQPVEPVQPPPRQQAPTPQAARPGANPNSQAQAQAKADRVAGQERDTLNRQTQARSAQARSESVQRGADKPAQAGARADQTAATADPQDRAAQTETTAARQAAQVQGTAEAQGLAEARASAAPSGLDTTAGNTPTGPAGLIALALQAPDSTAVTSDSKPGPELKDDRAQGRGPAVGATARAGKAQAADGADLAGMAGTSPRTGGPTAAGEALSTPGLQAATGQLAAPPGQGPAGPVSFEAVLGALQAQPGRPGVETGPTGATPPAATMELAQPLYSPDFAPEMAARLSLLAADGVQQAQLHLNPAEMGPVSVQILVEGQQAQISFHSDQAETRAVLENSLPELAAALRESGLTLSGGGVFQQARDPQQPTGSEAGRGGRAGGEAGADGADPIATPTPARASRGVLDLYA